MDTAVQLVQLYEANYPELLRKVFVINAPKVFEIAFALLKPFLHERTKNKISIYSHEPNVWKNALLAEIPPEELPVAYGGTMTDPDGDPNCKAMVNMGGEVPKSYYLNVKKAIANEKILTVNSGSREHVEFQVKEANSIIRWEFFSEDSDVAFALYQKKESELIPLVPRDRVDCHVSNEEGEIQCTTSGIYVAEFDNTFSYLRSKKIHYSITVEQAIDEDPEINGTDL